MVAPKETLEVRIGSRWLLYIGVIAIVVGAAYFIKLAFDSEWITPTTRVMLGGLSGLALAYAGTRFVRAGYSLYGQMIAGGGIALLYVSTYGAYNYYQLISHPMAFALMCGVTAFGALLAERQQSQGLALMAVGGGFATPFLLPADATALTALFAYDAIIVAGTVYLAGRRDWPFLNLLSYVGVCLTLAAWADELLAPARYLSTEIVLTVFCAMFLYVLRATRQSKGELVEAVRAILWSAPAGYYFSSLVVLNDHSAALLVFLLLLSLAGAVLARASRSSGVRATFWAATVVPLGGWIVQHAGHEWLMPGLVTVGAVYALTLISQCVAAAEDDGPWSNADIGLTHGNALFTALAAYVLVDAVRTDVTAPMIAGFALWHGVLSLVSARRDRRVALHFAALAFTMLAAATALQFHGAALTAAWAAEGSAVIWLGLREHRGWLRVSGGIGFMVAVGRLFVLLTDPPLAGQRVLLNERAACALFLIALTYALAWLYHRHRDNEGAVDIALIGANLLTLFLLTSEINAYFYLRGDHVWQSITASTLLTMAWTVVGTLLAWLGTVRRSSWTQLAGSVVLVIASLLFLQLELIPAPAGYMVMANPRLMAAATLVAALYWLASLARREPSSATGSFVRALRILAANGVTLLFLTTEISALWRGHDPSDVSAENQLARGAMLSVTWAAYATGVIVAGIRRRYAPARYFAMVVFALTIAKVFLLDMAELERAYRIVSIIGLGVMLLATSYMYQRFRHRLVAQDGRAVEQN